MDLKEFKKIASYAKKAGIKSFKVDGFEIEFKDQAISLPKTKAVKLTGEESLIKEDQAPTLDEINDYIYGDADMETQ